MDVSIQELRAREQDLVPQVMQSEKEREELLAKKRDCFEEAQSVQQEIDELMKKAEEKLSQVSQISLRLNELEAQLLSKDVELASGREKLRCLREAIKQQEKVRITMTADGRTVMVNESMPECPASTLAYLFSKFSEVLEGEEEDLPVKIVKQFARLLNAINVIEAEGKQYQLSFEDPKIAKIFYHVSNPEGEKLDDTSQDQGAAS